MPYERKINMPFDLVPKAFFNFPAKLNNFWEDEDVWLSTTNNPSGLTVSEDQNHVYVEASVPGVDPKHVEVVFEKGVLWIKAQHTEADEDKQKKYYRKSATEFSYHVSVPGKIDETQEPTAVCKNGVMKVTFKKSPQVQPKRIAVQVE